MTVGFNTLFGQRDVRETPISTATATAVGLTAPEYVTLALDPDLINERVLTAGAGIDFTDNGAGGTLVVAGDHDAGANFVANEHLDWTASVGTIHADNYTAGSMSSFTLTADSGSNQTIVNANTMDIEGGEGIDTVVGATDKVTISGEDATITNKGIASFDTTHFVVTAGEAALNNTVVNAINANTAHAAGDGSDHSLLANKTSYASITGAAFEATDGNNELKEAGKITAQGDNATYFGVIQIPNGAVVTGAVVYGNSANAWSLTRFTLNGAATAAMATAATDTEDTSISNATINNATYGYYFSQELDTNEFIEGARIKYTTDYV